MTAGRFLRWHRARRLVGAIKHHLAEGHTVVIPTYTRATKYDRRHLAKRLKAHGEGTPSW